MHDDGQLKRCVRGRCNRASDRVYTGTRFRTSDIQDTLYIFVDIRMRGRQFDDIDRVILARLSIPMAT